MADRSRPRHLTEPDDDGSLVEGYPDPDHEDQLEPITALRSSRFDAARVEAAVRELLIGIGEDPDREGLRKTPARVAFKAISIAFPVEVLPHG